MKQHSPQLGSAIHFFVLSVFLFTQVLLYQPLSVRAHTAQEPQLPVITAPHTNEILVKHRSQSDFSVVEVAPDEKYETVLNTYQHDPLVEYAEPNYKLYRTATIPDDEFFRSEQDYMEQISVDVAWDQTTGSRDVIVAVLDAGVDITHPDLLRNIWVNIDEIKGNNSDNDQNGYVDDVNGFDFLEETPDPRPKLDNALNVNLAGAHHGTVIAGIIGAVGNNAEGIAGVNWNVRIMPLRVLDSNGEGDVAAVVEGMRYAVDNGAKILNLSFVGYEPSRVFDEAIEEIYNSGSLIVAAAGNALNAVDGGINLDVTAAYPVCSNVSENSREVLGVSAIDSDDLLAFFSNYGSSCVDVAAPGVTIFSTQMVNKSFNLNEAYGGSLWSGTSFSAPLVSGVAALLLSVNPELTNNALYDIIVANGDDIDSLNPAFSGSVGKKLNAQKSIAAAFDTVGAVIPNPETPPVIEKKEVEFVEPAANNVTPRLRFSTSKIGAFSARSEGVDLRFFNMDLSLVSIVKGDMLRLPIDSSFQKGDVTGDDADEYVVYGGSNRDKVRVFSATGNLIKEFSVYGIGGPSEIDVALGNMNADEKLEILTAPKSRHEPRAKIFNGQGLELRSFLVYTGFEIGLDIDTGDVDADGVVEIVVGAGGGGGPQVNIFDPSGNVERRFFADDKNLRGGVLVSVGALTSSRGDQIATFALGRDNLPIRFYTHLGQEFGTISLPVTARDGVSLRMGSYNFDATDDVMLFWKEQGTGKAMIFGNTGIPLTSFDMSQLGVSGSTAVFFAD
ncbi:MAG TPA: S8 family peptidase [Patescibacteria group bacterium]|nr:S8 family peptidase [Patescibacteria group bacterium]